ncbi:MAG: transposase [Verrucomicrobiales bacterium]
MEQEHGVIVYCPPEENALPGRGGRQSRARQRTRDFREGMRACVRSERGRRHLRLRSVSVEPTIGYIKGTIGFRRFQLRGLKKVNLEWDLVCLGYNFPLLNRIQRRAAAK